MANQVQIPHIKTDNEALNQVQQNVNKVLRNVYNQSQDAINASTIIGEQKTAYLTEEEFQSQAGTNWVLCNGQGCDGSAYGRMKKVKFVPDARSTVMRMKDNGVGRNPQGDLDLGSYQTDTVGPHTHNLDYSGNIEATVLADGAANTGAFNRLANGGNGNFGNLSVHNTGVGITGETSGKATICNFFIRIN